MDLLKLKFPEIVTGYFFRLTGKIFSVSGNYQAILSRPSILYDPPSFSTSVTSLRLSLGPYHLMFLEKTSGFPTPFQVFVF
jgi:hypothetical protein